MKLTLGTPPVEVYGVYDTGSELVWTQCAPCPSCTVLKFPMFDPFKSRTYNKIYCNSVQCNEYFVSCSPQSLCAYYYFYYDSSITSGVIASDIASFISTDGEIRIKDFLFGCGHNDHLRFSDGNIMGIIGFDQGPLSLVSQIGNRFGGRRFTQCLVSPYVDNHIAGTINFGANIEAFGGRVVTTPLITRQSTPHYFVILKGVSVGNNFLPFNPTQQQSEGYMMLDSGTPSTLLPLELYNMLVQELRLQVGEESIEYHLEYTRSICFRSTQFPQGPILTFHFEGADVELMPSQTYFTIQEGVFCFGMHGVTQEPYVFGNLAQSSLLIRFDLDRRTISFQPTDCTKL
uniref:Aspartic proteinase nepenthesin-1 n=1 Tax=Cajanus cajan TaxID=3821 RepID=A0A151SG53_CAJCA|nr:Aspartic proteinase nepenthesin-1 [Cajanus cajan]